MSEGNEPAELRKAYDELKDNYSSLQKEHTTFKAATLFKEQNLSPKHADLFLAANPGAEITSETIQAFAEEYQLAPATEAATAEPPPTTPQTAPPSEGLASMEGAAGTPEGTIGEALPAQMSKEDFQQLLRTNPDAAAQAYAEGRVPRNSLNTQADQMQERGIIR